MIVAHLRSYSRALMLAALMAPLVFSGCSASALLTKVAIFKVNIKVVNENDEPIPGAIVQVTDGQQTTADQDGMASVKFAAAGVHVVTITAQDRAPATLRVTMPLDIGKTLTARLGQPVTMIGDIDININIGGNIMGGLAAGIMTQLYPLMFQALFTANGYNMELAPMKAGEWTEWETGDEDDPLVMRKAYLTKLDNSQEWWQVQISGDEADDTIIMEVLFSKGRQSIRRMRQQSGDEEAAEVPVTEGWYTPPMELTPESLEGAVSKKGVDVKVPAGAFKADLMEFGVMGGGKIRMWRVKNIPGGVVRVEGVDDSGEVDWVSQLKAHGAGAKTVLGSY